MICSARRLVFTSKFWEFKTRLKLSRLARRRRVFRQITRSLVMAISMCIQAQSRLLCCSAYLRLFSIWGLLTLDNTVLLYVFHNINDLAPRQYLRWTMSPMGQWPQIMVTMDANRMHQNVAFSGMHSSPTPYHSVFEKFSLFNRRPSFV